MQIKDKVKKAGRIFFELKQIDHRIIEQSVLIVDNGYGRIKQVEHVINAALKYFPVAKLVILTFEQRKNTLQKLFPELSYIIPSSSSWLKRYKIAKKMLGMRKIRYDFIILLSLDITPLIASLFFLKSEKVILYNQWNQWWSLKLRGDSISQEDAYIKPESSSGLKNLIKRIGLFFVTLQREREEIFRHSVLIVDNGRASLDQVAYAVRRIKASLPLAEISGLITEKRKDLFCNFSDIKIIIPKNCIIKRYRIARHMARLKHNKYDYVILLSLDITPIIALALFIKSKTFLINRWLQLWTLKPVPMRSYLLAIPRFLINAIINIFVFIYLIISASWIFLKRSFNISRAMLLGKDIE
ncbi:MAG: hypothetical protein WC357_08775 [Candidatus Omnitrophota bacterium]|jgi:hypothetical protein